MTQPWTDEDARILRAKHYADLRAPADSPMHQRGVVYGKALDHIEALEARVAELEAEVAQGRKLEREAVVAWLRDRANTEPCPTELAHASDAIEAGEHIKATP